MEDQFEIEFSPIAPEEAEELDNRVYLVGVAADAVRILF